MLLCTKKTSHQKYSANASDVSVVVTEYNYYGYWIAFRIPTRAPFDHIWAMVWSGARGNITI